MQLLINKLLISYFNSILYKIFLCLAYLKEESELIKNPCDQNETFKKSGKEKGKVKVKMKLKTKSKSKS